MRLDADEPRLGWSHVSWLLLLAASVLVFGTLRDYGPTWDEEVQAHYGDLLLRWYRSGFHDTGATAFRDLYLYGGLFEVMAQGTARVLPFALYTSRHLVNAFFGLLGVWAVMRIGSRIDGPRAGFLAALFLLATPRYFGHIPNNPKDIPFAAMAGLYIDAAVACVVSRRRDLPGVVWLGLTLGGALAIRVTGLLLPAGLVVALVLAGGSVQEVSRGMGRLVAAPFLIAWPVMVAFWPWAAQAPAHRPFEALFSLARGAQGWLVLFDGRWIETNAPPADYVPVWYLHTLPEFHFLALLALAGLALGSWRTVSRARMAPLALLAVSVLLPPCAAVAFRSRAYDAARHFLFCLPPLAALGGVAASRLSDRGVWGRAALGVLLGTVLLPVVEMVRLHPYEYVYFNQAIAGGLPGAARRFQLDYWGTSYKEGTEWLLAEYHRADRPRTRPIEVANCSMDFLTEGVLDASPRRSEFREVRKKDEPHVFLSLTNEECDIPLKGPPIHVVEREGVPLLEIREFRRPS